MKKLFAFLLSIVLIVACMAPVAHAASVDKSYRLARVWVNGKEIHDVTIYIDNQDTVLLYNFSDIFKIFPTECELLGIVVPATFEETPLYNWSNTFGYKQTLSGSNVYLEGRTVGIPEGEEKDYVSGYIWVNEKQVKDVMVYIDRNNNVFIKNYSDLFKIFPTECELLGLKLPASVIPSVFEGAPLSNWSNTFGYKQTVNGFNVYLEDKNHIGIPTPPTKPENGNHITIDKDYLYQNGIVYVNGLKIDKADVYINKNGDICLGSSRTLIDIFPDKSYNFRAGDSMYLRDWATKYGYNMAQRENRVYLWNYNQNPIEVYLNGSIVKFPDQQPIIIDGRTMVPVRAVSEALNWNVDFENTPYGGKVTLSNSKHFVIFYINSNVFYVDGKAYSMDVSAQIVSNRTMIPLRFAAEALGLAVGYDGNTAVKVVTLTSK